MGAKRRWAQWPGRTVQELNGVSGVAGLGGIGIGAGSLTFLSGAAALALTGVGAVIVVGAAGYALVRGFPPALKRPVAERARARLADAGLLERASIYGGNFLTDPLPEGADVISLVRIVHDHDDASALWLLWAVRRALPPKGTLLIAEAMSGIRGAESLDGLLWILLAMGRSEPRTVAETGRLLRQAGFGRFRLLRNRMPILIARPTSS